MLADEEEDDDEVGEVLTLPLQAHHAMEKMEEFVHKVKTSLHSDKHRHVGLQHGSGFSSVYSVICMPNVGWLVVVSGFTSHPTPGLLGKDEFRLL